MPDNKKVRITIHRGTNQIGGVCTEISTDEARVFFDIGSPLEGEGNQDILDIDGLTSGAVNTDAVFLTHYHGDHIGEIPFVDDSIPIYMEKTARRILEIQQDHMKIVGKPVWANKVNEITVGGPIQVKDLRITPIASDHSAANSVMYLIEGHDKRILLTGDYRLHGHYRDKLVENLKGLGGIDLMITEGTTITRESAVTYDEKWVEEQFRKSFEKYKYVFLFTSSSALDRIAAFSRCVPKGRYMLTDKYQHDLMQVYDAERDEKLKSNKVLYIGDHVMKKAEKAGFGMAIRANSIFLPILNYYYERYPKDTFMIYSMWSGYREFPSVKQLLDICEGKERTIHVSGHVTKEDLEHVIDIVMPQKLIIHHTSAKDEDKNLILYKGTTLLRISDGESVDL